MLIITNNKISDCSCKTEFFIYMYKRRWVGCNAGFPKTASLITLLNNRMSKIRNKRQNQSEEALVAEGGLVTQRNNSKILPFIV